MLLQQFIPVLVFSPVTRSVVIVGIFFHAKICRGSRLDEEETKRNTKRLKVRGIGLENVLV